MTLARAIFAVSLFGSWFSSLITILVADRMGYDRGLRLSRSDFANPVKRRWMLATLLYVAALGAFTTARFELLAGATVLVLVALVRRRAVATWPEGVVLRLGKYTPSAAALLGYLVAFALAWLLGFELQVRQRAGWEAGCGVFASCYVLSGIAKLQKSGWGWASSGTIALFMAERAHGAPKRLRQLRIWIIKHPWITSAAAKCGLLLELSAGGFVFGTLRWPLLIGLTALQLNITVLLGYFELEWILLALALTLGSVA